MNMEVIENDLMRVEASRHGAELCSILRKSDGREFLWQADPAYWKRHSPVLFPIVGSLWNNEMRQDDAVYRMSQHGFARDMDFELVEASKDEVRYILRSDEATHEKFPYDFELEIGYRLHGQTVEVSWQVRNTSADSEMHFQIGAHPAFNYMDFDPEAANQGYIQFDTSADKGSYRLSVIGEKGCLKNDRKLLDAPDGKVEITRHTFDGDALILESNQVNSVMLLDRQSNPYLRVSFNAPVVGLWSPACDSYAPFVCIEPWYGRCDLENYEGEFCDKDWTQHLKPGKQFNTEYFIDIL